MERTHETSQLDEDLVVSWVRLTGILKNGRLTDGLIYNEAVVMLAAYRRYKQDGEGLVSFKEIVSETRMLKSHVHRTIDSLVKKQLLERVTGADKRTSFVRPVQENLDAFLTVHRSSLALAEKARSIIGDEDAAAFIRLTNKICQSDLLRK